MTRGNWERYKSGAWAYQAKTEVCSNKQTQDEYAKHIIEIILENKGDSVWKAIKSYIINGVNSGQLTNRAIADILDDIVTGGGDKAVESLTRAINTTL